MCLRRRKGLCNSPGFYHTSSGQQVWFQCEVHLTLPARCVRWLHHLLLYTVRCLPVFYQSCVSLLIFSLGAKIAKINNRVVLGMCLLFTVFGSLLIGDWQSISHENNCRSFNTTHSSVEDSGSTELLGEYEPALFPSLPLKIETVQTLP